MSVVVQQVTTQFMRRADSGRGLSAAEAIAAAEARIDGMRDDIRSHIGQVLRDMLSARALVGTSDPAIEHTIRAQSDELVGLCGLFDLADVGAAASSLCKLIDNCRPLRPDARSIRVHLDALQVLWSLSPEIRLTAAPVILAGLSELVSSGTSVARP